MTALSGWRGASCSSRSRASSSASARRRSRRRRSRCSATPSRCAASGSRSASTTPACRSAWRWRLISSSLIAPRFGWRVCFLVLGVVGLVATALLLCPRAGAPPGRRRRRRSPPSAARRSRELLRDLGARAGRSVRRCSRAAGGSLLCYGSGAALLAVTWLVEDRGFAYADAAFLAGRWRSPPASSAISPAASSATSARAAAATGGSGASSR